MGEHCTHCDHQAIFLNIGDRGNDNGKNSYHKRTKVFSWSAGTFAEGIPSGGYRQKYLVERNDDTESRTIQVGIHSRIIQNVSMNIGKICSLSRKEAKERVFKANVHFLSLP